MADGTVNSGGSSAPGSGGKQVKPIQSTSTNYRPQTNTGGTSAYAVPETPLAGGAPTAAPSQTIITTGHGPTQKGLEGHEGPPGQVPPPASHASTNVVEGGPSVDYNTQQGGRPQPVQIAQHKIIYGEQDQQMQDQANG
jgi:hypothetical protein